MEKFNKDVYYYANKLKALSKSNTKYDFIVEDKQNAFLIYKEFNFLSLSSQLAHYKATVDFVGEEIHLKIKMQTKILFFIIVFYLFVLAISIVLLIQDNFSFLFFAFVSLVASISIPIGRRRFKKHLISFLNNIE